MLTANPNSMLGDLLTAHIADACLRLDLPFRLAPSALRPTVPRMRAADAVRPVQHFGSADVVLEAIDASEPGDVLVVDNGGRPDEACVGDLVVLEAQAAGLGGIVIWGFHRNTRDVAAIGFPVFSMGTIANGPRRLEPRTEDALVRARIGECMVDTGDAVVADDDGVLFLPASLLEKVARVADGIRETERRQAHSIAEGTTLRHQFHFEQFLARRRSHPDFTFREHLRGMGAAIEE